MATIQQSIEVGVPVHTAYHQLTQFGHYPRFMQYVESVQQLDATHLHWATRMPHQRMEWDCEITEQLPDRCIAWRNVSGPESRGKVELQPTGSDAVRVTLTMECDPLQFASAQDGSADAELAWRIGQDLVRFKKLVETPGLQVGDDAEAQSSGAAVGKTIGQSDAERRETGQSGAPAAPAPAAEKPARPA